MVPAFGQTIRLVSRVICVILLAWFLVFAVDQTKEASGHQTAQLAGPSASQEEREDEAQKEREAKKTGVHKVLDEAAETLTSPFKNVVSDTSEWLKNGELVVLALLLYGFGLGYLARMLRAP